jgi:hypothetical protein
MSNTEDGGNARFTEQLPPPPPFWTRFTTENVDRVQQLKEEQKDIPPELETLLPPSVPNDGKYKSFGGTFDVRFLLLRTRFLPS